MRLGCIADDLTGATDLALMLAREGMNTIQTTGVPGPSLDLTGADAVVVALKSRTIPANEAVTQSLAAAAALRAAGARHYFFKYCSTFEFDRSGQYRTRRGIAVWISLPAISPSPVLLFPPTDGRSTRAFCSSTACRSTRAA